MCCLLCLRCPSLCHPSCPSLAHVPPLSPCLQAVARWPPGLRPPAELLAEAAEAAEQHGGTADMASPEEARGRRRPAGRACMREAPWALTA